MEYDILEHRGRNRDEIKTLMAGPNGTLEAFKNKYWDARLFGNTFLEEGGGDTIRAGVAHFGVGVSLAPIEIEFSTWTSKAGVESGKDRGMAPMAFRVLKHGIFAVPFFVNPARRPKPDARSRMWKPCCAFCPTSIRTTRQSSGLRCMSAMLTLSGTSTRQGRFPISLCWTRSRLSESRVLMWQSHLSPPTNHLSAVG